MSMVLVEKASSLTSEQSHSLLPVLLEYQKKNPCNYISEENVKEIAEKLNLSRSRVYSTASFYSEISLVPRGKHLIRICCNAPCENAGKEAIHRAVKDKLGIDVNETTEDGLFTLEIVNCLGACYMSPAMKIDDQVFGNLTPESAVEIIKKMEQTDEE